MRKMAHPPHEGNGSTATSALDSHNDLPRRELRITDERGVR